jgi:deazaflavin-dependent oxidoreductase (nitroreductase family)
MNPLPDELVKQPYCYLTTTGRMTGSPHTIEIWFGADPSGARIFLLSGGGDRSDWVKNLVASPMVHVRIGEREWDTEAHVVHEPGQDRLARDVLATKYQGWHEGEPRSEWARTALPIAIEIPD